MLTNLAWAWGAWAAAGILIVLVAPVLTSKRNKSAGYRVRVLATALSFSPTWISIFILFALLGSAESLLAAAFHYLPWLITVHDLIGDEWFGGLVSVTVILGVMLPVFCLHRLIIGATPELAALHRVGRKVMGDDLELDLNGSVFAGDPAQRYPKKPLDM